MSEDVQNQNHLSEAYRLLSRHDWLRSHGLADDPFPVESFQAETDPLFDQIGMPAFVDPLNYERIRGWPGQLGYRFIFAASGGGKSSLRRRMKRDFDESLTRTISGTPKVLAVEYIDHDYPLDEVEAESHIVRIVRLIQQAAKEQSLPIDLDISEDVSPRVSLAEIAKKCKTAGLDGVYILIDNIDAQYGQGLKTAFHRIQKLATHLDLLRMKNVAFKFMLPLELLVLARQSLPLNHFPAFIIKWDESTLESVLNQRMATCSESRIGESVLLSDLCSEQPGDSLTKDLLAFGVQTNSPRAMWQLGYYVLEEHFNQSRECRQLSTRLIESSVILRAYDRVLSEVSIIRVTQDNALVQDIKEKTGLDNLEEALQLFKQINENLAIVLQAKLRRTQAEKRRGNIKREEADVEMNNVINTLLEELNKAQENI